MVNRKEEKMEKRKAKRLAMVLGMVTLMLVFFSSEAFPWGFATHAFSDDLLGKRRGQYNASEIYGGMAPDVFNYLFDYPAYMTFLTEETHANFMKVWKSARRGLQKPLAYGFVSHGVADARTHQLPDGYAMAKAAELLDYLSGEFRTKVGDELLVQMLHIIVENAVDILIVQNDDHLIGRKMISAALVRSPEFPLLLVKAYASDLCTTFGITPLEASKFIVSAEKEFRKSIVLYGQILTLDEPTAIRLISEQTADAAVAYLGLYNIKLSDLFPDEEEEGPIPLEERFIQLIVALTGLAISTCADDYQGEIYTTIGYVDDWLEENDVSD